MGYIVGWTHNTFPISEHSAAAAEHLVTIHPLANLYHSVLAYVLARINILRVTHPCLESQ